MVHSSGIVGSVSTFTKGPHRVKEIRDSLGRFTRGRPELRHRESVRRVHVSLRVEEVFFLKTSDPVDVVGESPQGVEGNGEKGESATLTL